MARKTLLALLPWLAFALARSLESALGLVLHTGIAGPFLLGAALRALDPREVLLGAGLSALTGLLAWVALGALRSRGSGWTLADALQAEAGAALPLLLIPATTLVAVLALQARSSFPYGHTLAVALTQDLTPARLALVAAVFLAHRTPALRLPAPRAGEVLFVSFLAYALLTPERARSWDNHPGNEPKYLRMAVALGHSLSLDVEPVSAAMEDLEPSPFATALRAAAAGLVRESGRMALALARGPEAVGRGAITATRITRQTIGGKNGGVYHVLAPGQSLLMAPALRMDRALNRAFGTPGRLAASVLVMNALGALLVMALFQLLRDATGRAGLAAAVAFAFALLPPFLFYFFQFYPEMPGALVLAVVFRWLFLKDALSPRAALGVGALLAFLPWLHQKFLPVWAVLVATAVVLAWRRGARRDVLIGFVLPQLVSLYLTALYNFAIAGSVRPDALFLAWGPAGVTTARLGQGLLGLWLDARYGLLPYAPIFALAAAGLLMEGSGPDRLRRALPAALVYYLTVAAADNWAGAVCNLGRYLMPVLPLAIAFVAVAIDRTGTRKGARAVTLLLFGCSGLLAHALWRDPHAANDSAFLLAKSRFAEGTLYIPGLFIRTWAAGAPGLWLRVALWLLLILGLAAWLVRVGKGRGGERPFRAAAAVLGLVLAAAALLERWPPSRTAPAFPFVQTLEDGRVVFPEGSLRAGGTALEAAGGTIEFVVRGGGESLPLLVGGTGLLRLSGRPPLPLRPEGLPVEVPLAEGVVVTGRGGAREELRRGRIVLQGREPAAALLFPITASPMPHRPELTETPER